MKLILSIFVFAFLTQNLQAQKSVYLDENSNNISQTKFLKIWRNKKFLLSRWDSIGENKKRYCSLKPNLYIMGVFNYDIIKKHLETSIGRDIENDKTILLEYCFKDDLCTTTRDNSWYKSEVIDRKIFLSPIREKIEKEQNIIYIYLFEESILLENSFNDKNEYFYKDQGNFFRNNIFKNPTLCGSYALIKPNGETLIRNGEYRPDNMVQYLKSKNWSIFFDD